MYDNFRKDLRIFLNTPKSRTLLAKLRRLNQYPGMKMVLMHRLINETPKYLFMLKVILKFVYRRMMFKYGIYLPLDLTFGNNLRIFHWGGVIINPNAKIGNNVTIMQGVTIGNNMKNSKCPVISDNVFIGAGAKVIGDVFVAKGVRIGANAVVTKSIYQENITVVGIPARNIK